MTESKLLIRIDIITAAPETLDSYLNSSILGRAQEKGVVEIAIHNLHDYALDKFRHIDNAPFGGTAGMLIQCQPVFDCIEKLQKERDYDEIIFTSADGEKLSQNISNELSLKKNIIIICGRYKGIDQRIREHFVSREISIGDFVLTGGELPAMVLIDSIIRLLPGAIGHAESALEDSFQDGLLEAPQYTRPADFRGMKVPDVLLSGNHKEIAKWKYEQALEKTKTRRPDLLK